MIERAFDKEKCFKTDRAQVYSAGPASSHAVKLSHVTISKVTHRVTLAYDQLSIESENLLEASYRVTGAHV